MTKKILISILALILIAIIVGYCIEINKDVYEVFSLCNIKTYDGQVIDDYEHNKRAFLISDYDEQAEIKVNGEKYQKDFGYYNVGEYEIEVKLNNVTEKRKIIINEIDKEKQNEYNIYLTAETLPTLFASFDMMKEKDVESFIWFQREGTLNVDELKKIFTKATFSEHIGEGDNDFFRKSIAPEVRKYISNVLNNDENAHFNVYVTAEYYWMEFETLDKLGLTDAQIDTIMYSCGTIDYVVDYSITHENAYDEFVAKKDKFDEILHNLRSNVYANDLNLKYANKESGTKDANYVLINSLRENVEYYLQFPELITFKDNKVNDEMKKSNMNKIIAREQFNKLTDEQKEEFFKCISLDKKKFDEEYFNVEDGKYLIITGTRPYYGRYMKTQFENLIEQVIEKYGKEYTILFKPHPKAIPVEQDEKFLTDKGIKILPGVMPMEAIAFVYDNLKLGGFASSLYMSVDEGSTLFFFAEKKEDLVEPLNVLYDNLFKEAEFIIPTNKIR